jgi:5-methylcytosine-specific restriction endonuclease McrA
MTDARIDENLYNFYKHGYDLDYVSLCDLDDIEYETIGKLLCDYNYDSSSFNHSIMKHICTEIAKYYRSDYNCSHGNIPEMARDIIDKYDWRPKPTYEDYLKSEEWDKKRKLVLKRDDYTCQGCLAKHVPLEVHHKTYKNIQKEFLFELVSLCHDCHKRIHGKDTI